MADDVTSLAAGRLALGYCWPQSVRPGASVALHLSAPAGAVDVEVVRDGPGPAGGEVAWRGRVHEATPSPLPDDAPERGCGWPAAATIDIRNDWRSGLYLVRLSREGAEAWDPPTAWFVVRPAQPRPGAIVLALATNTWNAYNDAGGRNLYTGAVEMSFARPLALGFLAKPDAGGARVVAGVRTYAHYTADEGLSLWHGMSGWAGQERRFAAWAERSGIALEYATNADLDDLDDLDDPDDPGRWHGRRSCSASATTSTGRGVCATPSRASSTGAGTPRSCPATRAIGRSAWRRRPRRSRGRTAGRTPAPVVPRPTA